jgi:hypothetical protein
MEIIASAPAQMGPCEIGDWAARVEQIGFDTIHISETIHDPFTIATLALTHTTRVTVRTSMALAFPRSPMITAYVAWDLAKYSEGRFQLGIASQVRGDKVPKHLTDEVMNRVIPQGTYEEIPTVLTEWYSGLCHGLCLPVAQDDTYDNHFAELVERCKVIPIAREPTPF